MGHPSVVSTEVFFAVHSSSLFCLFWFYRICWKVLNVIPYQQKHTTGLCYFLFLKEKNKKKNVDLGGASTKLRGRGKEREIIRRQDTKETGTMLI
jgi:hypothetical protein